MVMKLALLNVLLVSLKQLMLDTNVDEELNSFVYNPIGEG